MFNDWDLRKYCDKFCVNTYNKVYLTNIIHVQKLNRQIDKIILRKYWKRFHSFLWILNNWLFVIFKSIVEAVWQKLVFFKEKVI